MNDKKKREALSVTRLINEVLIKKLSIPLRQIVNDTIFKRYTGIKRPDLLISEYEFLGNNEDQYIRNLVAYAEVKDNCVVNDCEWINAINQGKIKAPKLSLPYFIITNCKTSIFYNASNEKEISLNGNPIREFQTIDIFRLIINKLNKEPTLVNITTNVDSISAISEAVFTKKLWEIKNVYRGISFKNNVEKIDFTIGFVALEFFEEKAQFDGEIDNSKFFWSSCWNVNSEILVANLSAYITRLERETTFKDFKKLIESVRINIMGESGKAPLINPNDVKSIYEIVNSMRPLHNSGFDLFGAVYEEFANANEKRDFGEFFTRRHYTHVFAKILLKEEQFFDIGKKFRVLDLACGTGGFLTEGYKVLRNNYIKSGTFNDDSRSFLEKDCFYGIDSREENIFRTKLNMFLVGDGHTNIFDDNTLTRKFKNQEYDYILTNPPYGDGTIMAETDAISSKRLEVAFLFKIINVLKIGGKACVIVPDGILESPSLRKLRNRILERVNIHAIISLPKFAFAPYTKEKTYAFFLTKRSNVNTRIQKSDIWFYIIDNDGLANSDKRFPTKLRNNKNGWRHDEISGWVSTEGEEMKGLLEERWQKFDDSDTDGTEWVSEKNEKIKLRKGKFMDINTIISDKYFTLLPEYYLRPHTPSYIEFPELIKKSEIVLNKISSFNYGTN